MAARATRSTVHDGPCTPARGGSPTTRSTGSPPLFATEEHVAVEATWRIYQRMIAAYREEDRRRGRELMVQLIDSISTGVPKALTEVITLGRTLKKRAADVLAYFRPTRHQQRPDRGHQRPTRTPPRQRTRVPEPDQLHRQVPARDRRLQASSVAGVRARDGAGSAPAMGWVEHGNPPRSSLRRRSTWTDTESLIRTRIVR